MLVMRDTVMGLEFPLRCSRVVIMLVAVPQQQCHCLTLLLAYILYALKAIENLSF